MKIDFMKVASENSIAQIADNICNIILTLIVPTVSTVVIGLFILKLVKLAAEKGAHAGEVEYEEKFKNGVKHLIIAIVVVLGATTLVGVIKIFANQLIDQLQV